MNCQECEQPALKKFCSNACRQKAYRKRNVTKETNVTPSVTNQEPRNVTKEVAFTRPRIVEEMIGMYNLCIIKYRSEIEIRRDPILLLLWLLGDMRNVTRTDYGQYLIEGETEVRMASE